MNTIEIAGFKIKWDYQQFLAFIKQFSEDKSYNI